MPAGSSDSIPPVRFLSEMGEDRFGVRLLRPVASVEPLELSAQPDRLRADMHPPEQIEADRILLVVHGWPEREVDV